MKKRLMHLVAAVTMAASTVLGAGSALAHPKPSAAPAAAPVPVASAAPAVAPAPAAPAALPPVSPTGPDYTAVPLESKDDRKVCQEEKKDCKKTEVKPAPTKCGSGTTGQVISKAGFETCECKYEGDVAKSSFEAGVRRIDCLSSADFVRELAGKVAVGQTLLEELKKDTAANAEAIAKLEPRIKAVEEGLNSANGRLNRLEHNLMLLDEAIYGIMSRLEKVEKKVAKQPEGGAGAQVGFLAGPDGFSPTAALALRFFYPLPTCGVAAQVTGGILHRAPTSKTIGRATAAVGPSCQPKDSVSVMLGLHGGQDIDGPGQRIGQDVEHFPGRDIGVHLEVDVKPTENVLITLGGQVGAREATDSNGSIRGGVFVGGQVGFNLGNW